MKWAAVLAVLLMPSVASAQTVSPKGCRVLAESAEVASETIAGVVTKSSADKMTEVLPMLSLEGQRAADKMERARAAALGPMSAYADAMAEFAKAMRTCAK
ncbi:hypothetical protein NKG99_03745 [Mesorhizobium sp. M1409]|uniref:hypothetical protein n=1 Tax=Mesorhizobium sp. M1409 TaxID=2957100 RepID=UPI00333B27FB